MILVAWGFITLAGSIGAAMAYEPLRSFGPTLYFIDGALLLVVFGLSRLWRSVPRMAMFATAVVVLGGVALVTATSLSPSGKYAVGGCKGPGLKSFGISDEYYELSGGVFYDVVNGRRHRVGSYRRKDGQWIVEHDGDGPFAEQKLRFSMLGFYTVIPAIEGNEGGPTDFNRRRLIPFTRPHWMPEWLE